MTGQPINVYYVVRHDRITQELADDLAKATTFVLVGARAGTRTRVNPEDVLTHVMPYHAAKLPAPQDKAHVSAMWYVNAEGGVSRKLGNEWVEKKSAELAQKIGKVLRNHVFPMGTVIVINGQMLPATPKPGISDI